MNDVHTTFTVVEDTYRRDRAARELALVGGRTTRRLHLPLRRTFARRARTAGAGR